MMKKILMEKTLMKNKENTRIIKLFLKNVEKLLKKLLCKCMYIYIYIYINDK